jgi:hypothetical protein
LPKDGQIPDVTDFRRRRLRSLYHWGSGAAVAIAASQALNEQKAAHGARPFVYSVAIARDALWQRPG